MGIKFVNQPPEKVGDIKLDATTENTGIGYDAEFGFDGLWVEIGAEDTRKVFTNILEHAAPSDVIDFELIRTMLYDVASNLSYEGMQESYKKGVDLYIDRIIEVGKQKQA